MNALTWLLQRISAALLVIVLGIHIWLQYVSNSDLITYSDASARLSSAPFVVLYVLILVFGLFHALNGVYSILVDIGLKMRKTTAAVLVCAGLGLVSLGLYSVSKFIM